MPNSFQHAHFFSTCQSLFCVVGFEGSFRHVNQATLTILGYSIEEILALSFLELVHPGEQRRTNILLEALSESDSALTFSASIRTKAGDYRDFIWQATPALMEFAFYAVGIDATRCKQDMQQTSQEELREAHTILQERYADLQLMYEELQASVGGNAGQYQYYPSVIDCRAEGAALQSKNGQLNVLNPQRVEAMLGEPLNLSDFMSLWQSTTQQLDPLAPAHYVLRKPKRDPLYLQVRQRLLKNPQTQETLARLLVFQDISREVRLGQQLHKLQDDMATVTRSHAEGIISWDLLTNSLDYSASWKEMLGFNPDDSLGRSEETWFSRIHPQDYQAVINEIRKYIKLQQGVFDLKYRIQHKDGSYCWVQNNGRVLKEQNGRALRFISVFADITEQQKTQQTLHSAHQKAEKESLYHYLFNEQADACLIFAQDDRHIIDLNPVALKLYGYSREEWRDSGFEKVYADAAQCIADVRQTLKTQHTHIPLSWHKRKNGGLFPVEIGFGRCKIKGQKLLCASVRDISERHLREQALREERNQYGTIFHTAPFPILYLDRNSQVLRANRYSAQWLNSRPEMLEGQRLRDLKLDYESSDERLDEQVLKSGQAHLGERKSIGGKDWQLNRLPYRDTAGNVIGLILFIVHVSASD